MIVAASCAGDREAPAPSPWAASNPDWVEAIEPFRLSDNIYFAGICGFFAMEEKRARQIEGDENAFVDPDGFAAMMTALEAAFEKTLAEQTAKAAGQ